MAITLTLVGALSFAALAVGTAHAVPLPPATDTPLTGTTVAARPELAGVIIEDVLVPYSFTGAGGEAVSGQVQNRVVRSDVDGTLDFYWRIIPDPNSIGSIEALRVGGFGDIALDGDFRLDGLGDVGPNIARNFGGGFVNFLFDDAVGPDETSFFFFLDTQATAYALTGSYDLLCAPSGCVSPAFDTFAPAPVPEPSAAIMLALLTLLGAGVLARGRHVRGSAR
jgi:hypothetical protein